MPLTPGVSRGRLVEKLKSEYEHIIFLKSKDFIMENKTKKNLLGRVALLTALLSTGIFINGGHNEEKMEYLGKFIFAADRNVVGFVSQNDKTPFKTFLDGLKSIFNDFGKNIENLVARGDTEDDLTKAINEIIDYALSRFNTLYEIMQKYNGKPASEAFHFGTEIIEKFNPEKVFGDMVIKLKALKCKASQAGEAHLVKKIDVVITMIEKKKKEWSSKSDITLLGGLTYRMNCK